MKLEIESSEELEVASKAIEAFRAERIRHVGRFYRRMGLPCEQTTREKALSEGWRKENESRLGLGGPILRTLLEEDPEIAPTVRLTPEIARAVATVVQWLGTNVGFGALCGWLKNAGYIVVKADNFRDARRAG